MATFTGDDGANSITGTAGADTLDGQGGNDNLQGGAGDDSVLGGAGNDTVAGNDGADWVQGGAGNDTVSGGSGQDHFLFAEAGGANADIVTDFASAWDDIRLDVAGFSALGAAGRFATNDVRFFSGAGATSGHDADDRIIFNTTTHQLFYDADGNGGGAAQLIATFSNNANVVASDLSVFGTPASNNQTINGTSGNDTLAGGPGNDTINGLDGNDSITGAGGFDSLIGGNGNDTLDGTSANPTGPGEAHEADTLDGGAGDDTYIVGANDVILADPSGVDTVHALDTSWTLSSGLENLVLQQSPNVDGDSGTGNALDNVIDASTLDHAGTLSGLDGNDTLFSAQNGGVLLGGAGDDELHGHKAILNGGAGNDTLIGDGTNLLVFDAAPGAANADTHVGSVADEVQLDGNAFANLGPSGQFSADDARFFSGAGADAGHDADDRVIYDTTTGQLWYDADGNGAGAAQLIVTMQGAPTFNAQFISVVNGGSSDGAINGTEGNDTLTGTPGNDTINGLGGDDSIVGGAGADSMSGGAGNDTLDGSNSPGFSSQDPNVDTMDGGLGNDTYFVDNAGDVLVDSGGIDTVVTHNTDWTLGSGFENLVVKVDDEFGTGIGNELDNVIDGTGAFKVTLEGLAGDDLLIAGTKSSLFGGDGNDTLKGADLSSLDGGNGNDVLFAGPYPGGSPTLTGGDGADTFVFDQTPSSASSGSFITDFGSGVDKIQLDAHAMTALGASGSFSADDARFFSAAGATGGHDADDRVVYDTSSGSLYYDADGNGAGVAQLIAQLQAAPTLSATDIAVINGTATPPPPDPGRSINGTSSADSITGGSGNDSIQGGAGNDTIDGGAGNDNIGGNDGVDSIAGGAGNDMLSGGSGQDHFVFHEFGSANADTISDFASNWDGLSVDHAAFTAAGADGRFATNDARFFAGAGATAGHDADDRFVYDTTAGQLYYDADGSGSGQAQLVATIAGHPAVTATDITVI